MSAFKGVSYQDEDQLKAEMVVRMEEKQHSRLASALMRHGFATTPRQAQIAIFILFLITLGASAYFYVTTLTDEAPVARDPYVRTLPYR